MKNFEVKWKTDGSSLVTAKTKEDALDMG